MAEKYDAVVIGAGVGGLACAALVAKWGLRPLVLEKNERTGGQGGECMGLGQVVGQCGRNIPSSSTSIQGLFLVGIGAGPDPNANMGLQRSVNSAMNVARAVVRYHRLRQVCS